MWLLSPSAQTSAASLKLAACPHLLDAVRGAHCDRLVDMLFSDILVPGGMSGVALATEARKLYRGMGVLLTSGYTADERVDLRASGFALIEKPYRHDKLAQMLRIALDIRREAS